MSNGTPYRIVIIGGGISGLATAHRLFELSRDKGRALDIKLLEASARLGGVIATTERDGFIREAGPDSFISEKPWALDLCRRLGLESQLIGTQPENRRAFIARGRRLLEVPEGFYLLAPSKPWPFLKSPIVSWPGKARMTLDLILPRRKDGAEESLEEFVTRRLGREALERVAQPLVGGIYTADPFHLSVKATMPRFLELETKHRSLILAMMRSPRKNANRAASGPRYGLFVSFARGMQTLVDALAARLPQESVHFNQGVRAVERKGAGWLVTCNSGDKHEADAVCLALPAHQPARLLALVDAALARELEEVHYSSVGTLNLAYRRADVRHPLNGSGFVVPAVEKRSILACTFSSQKFAGRTPEGCVLLRAFIGGAMAPQQLEGDDATLVERVRDDLREFLGITAPPLFHDLNRYSNAMAQYTVGHLKRVARIRELAKTHNGLFLAGNGFQGVGIPDCIHTGEEAAEQLYSASAVQLR